MATTYLDFERPLAELDKKIVELDKLHESDGVDVTKEVTQLQKKSATLLANLYKKLGPWEKTQIARHPDRPHFSQYVDQLITDFVPLSGDRKYGDDDALMGGTGWFRGRAVMVMGHEKGKDTESRLKHNFGMANPEGYRKAARLMELADKFNLPILSFVDTAGAFPGRGAEERGQAEAIARSIDAGLAARVPFISVITGEGGSGGAVAIATADKVMMLEHSIYSVISPEGCASILWRDASKAQDAAKAMRITAQDLSELGIIDEIIEEPQGGAHRHVDNMVTIVGDKIEAELGKLAALSKEELIAHRRDKFLNIGRSLLESETK